MRIRACTYRWYGEIKREKIRLHILYARFHSALYHFPTTKAARERGNMCRISVICTNERENNPMRRPRMRTRANVHPHSRDRNNNAFGGFMRLYHSYAVLALLTLCSRVTERFYRFLGFFFFPHCAQSPRDCMQLCAGIRHY